MLEVQNIIYIAVTMLNLGLSLLILRHVAGSLALKKLNIMTWNIYFPILLQLLFASVFVLLGLENHYRISNQLSDESVRFYGWLTIQWVLLGMVCGMAFMKVVLRGKSSDLNTYIQRPIEQFRSRSEKLILAYLVALTFLTLAIALFYFVKLGSIPIFKLLSSDIDTLQSRGRFRETMRGPSAVAFNIFCLTLLPILSYNWFIYMKKGNKFLTLLFCLCFVFSIFALTAKLSKAPIVFYFIGFLFIQIYSNGLTHFRQLMVAGVIFTLLIVVAYYLESGKFVLSQLSLNSGIGGRILLGQAMGTYFSLDVFGTTREFLGFSSVTGMFDGEKSERVARLLMIDLNPQGVADGTAGEMTSNFIAESWGNFGLAGAILSPLYVGAVIYFIFWFFTHSVKHPIYLAFFAFLSYRLPVNGGFNGFIYNVPIFFMIALLFSVFVLSPRRTPLAASKLTKNV